MDSDLKFLIVCSGYNGAQYIKRCFKSIVNQTYKNFTAILIDDGSMDNSGEILNSLYEQDDRVHTFSYNENKGAAYRRYKAIKSIGDQYGEIVVCLLGMDDELKPNALEIVKKHYDAGKWMTYGNWVASDGYKLAKGFLNYADNIHATRDYRKDTYRSTALNTFKKKLFDKLTEDDFKYKGEWVKATTESNLMFSCLEMCGKDRIGVINEPIYIYNRRKDNTRNRMGPNYQTEIFEYVKQLPKRELI